MDVAEGGVTVAKTLACGEALDKGVARSLAVTRALGLRVGTASSGGGLGVRFADGFGDGRAVGVAVVVLVGDAAAVAVTDGVAVAVGDAVAVVVGVAVAVGVAVGVEWNQVIGSGAKISVAVCPARAWVILPVGEKRPVEGSNISALAIGL